MRRLLVALACLAPVAAAPAGATDGPACLSPGDMREVVASNRVVSPVVALRAARQAWPGSDVMRAQLCLRGADFVYILVVLRRDGRFVEVTVDGASGRVAALP